MKAKAFVLALVLPTIPVAATAQDAWLPRAGDKSISAVYTFQTFENFFLAESKATYPFGRSVQQTWFATFEYGLTESLALDLTAAYTYTSTSASPDSPAGVVDEGLADTAVGLRWRIVDEFEASSAPTLTLRVGGIVAGTYDVGLPYSSGDGASGVEVALLAGRDFGARGFGLYGELGYRHRAEHVPADLVAQVGAYKTFGGWSASAGLRQVRALSGSDIGDPGFRFQELREIASYLEASFGHSSAGGRY
jgi:hypothetical protein